MCVEFKDNSGEVKAALNRAVKQLLHMASEMVESQAEQNTAVDSSDTKGSWDYTVDAAKGEAKIGSPLQNAVWEEFGTGDYALEKGRSTPWYVPVDEKTKKKKPSYNGKVVIVYGKNGRRFYKTNGKKPRRTLHNAFHVKKAAIIKRAEQMIKSEMEK